MYNIVKSTFVSASIGKRYNQCLFRYAAHQLNKEPKPNVKNVKDNYLIYNFGLHMKTNVIFSYASVNLERGFCYKQFEAYSYRKQTHV